MSRALMRIRLCVAQLSWCSCAARFPACACMSSSPCAPAFRHCSPNVKPPVAYVCDLFSSAQSASPTPFHAPAAVASHMAIAPSATGRCVLACFPSIAARADSSASLASAVPSKSLSPPSAALLATAPASASGCAKQGLSKRVAHCSHSASPRTVASETSASAMPPTSKASPSSHHCSPLALTADLTLSQRYVARPVARSRARTDFASECWSMSPCRILCIV
mmetsp:Transcript_33293/g.82774  ORF Transcript_33293/g.82774 Transcript_33293/m.82774 type:complete len:222 (-) Transcript_33293:987-1652(-)